MRRLARTLAGWLSLAAGCQPSAEPPPVPIACAAGQTTSGLACCPAGTLALDDGSCLSPGFGEEPLLPPPCRSGSVAFVGETRCHPVGPCPSEAWDAIVGAADTELVDGSYAGSDSDGSQARPWRTVAEAVAAAALGAVVAIAPGAYAGVVVDKPVRLWGRCPDEVVLSSAPANAVAVIDVRPGASGLEVHDLQVTGATTAVAISGADVLLDRVWIHDTGGIGIVVLDELGAASAIVQRSLVESATYEGVVVLGARATLTELAIRDTRVDPVAGDVGWGISAGTSLATGAPASLVVQSAVLERNHEIGVHLHGVTAELADVVVRDVMPVGEVGRGLELRDEAGHRSTMALRRAWFERSYDVGMMIAGSDADIESVVVRGTRGDAAGLGAGMVARSGIDGAPAELRLSAALLERNAGIQLHLGSARAEMSSVLVRDAVATAANPGAGIVALGEPGAVADVVLRGSSIERSGGAGLVIMGGVLEAEALAVREVGPDAEGRFGDGVAVASIDGDARGSAVVHASEISVSARAALSSFGGQIALGSTRLDCSSIFLNAESANGAPPTFDDRGGNDCGCSTDRVPCAIETSGLAPPAVQAP